ASSRKVWVFTVSLLSGYLAQAPIAWGTYKDNAKRQRVHLRRKKAGKHSTLPAFNQSARARRAHGSARILRKIRVDRGHVLADHEVGVLAVVLIVALAQAQLEKSQRPVHLLRNEVAPAHLQRQVLNAHVGGVLHQRARHLR